jgi:hypothetical protein
MSQHYIFHERFDTPTGYAWRVGTVCLTEADAKHVGDWLAQRKTPEAFEPVPQPANTMPPNCMDGGEYRAALQFESATGDLNPDACKSGVCATD